MIVNLRLGEPIWRKINQRELVIDWIMQSITVNDFILMLGKRYPELTEDILGDTGDMDFHFAIFLNGVHMPWSESKISYISNNDQIMILMPLSGG